MRSFLSMVRMRPFTSAMSDAPLHENLSRSSSSSCANARLNPPAVSAVPAAAALTKVRREKPLPWFAMEAPPLEFVGKNSERFFIRLRVAGCQRWAGVGRVCVVRSIIPEDPKGGGDVHVRPVSRSANQAREHRSVHRQGDRERRRLAKRARLPPVRRAGRPQGPDEAD